MNEMRIVEKAIEAVRSSQAAMCRFITPNDVGKTGSHQSGYLIPKSCWSLFFDQAGVKGANTDVTIEVCWQDSFTLTNRVVYYGQGTRNEYRMTRFGRGFEFLSPDNVGNLLIICRSPDREFLAFVLESDDDIESFLVSLGLDVSQVGGLIESVPEKTIEQKLQLCLERYVQSVSTFPLSTDVSKAARDCVEGQKLIRLNEIPQKPDETLLLWLRWEFELFKNIELKLYKPMLEEGFRSLDQLIKSSNTILNRRKSRAGKSLENQLASIFDACAISYTAQCQTENHHRPDFIFPGDKQYHTKSFSDSALVMLAAKTTCKDRWRQILNEAARVRTKHLFTLQPAISDRQVSEMNREGVVLVIPKQNLKGFAVSSHTNVITLETFVKKLRQGH